MKRKKRATSSSSGCVIVDLEELEKVCREKKTWVQMVFNKADLSHHTLARIKSGLPLRPSSVEKLGAFIGPENLGRVARRVGLAAHQEVLSAPNLAPGTPVEEWVIDQVLTKWITTTNGLQFRVVKMRHKHLTDTWARGKCYELGHLSDDDRARVRDQLLRHPTICRKLAPHPRFTINERTFPDPSGDHWWVVDQWIPGNTLNDVLANGPLAETDLLRVAREIAEGLQSLHRHKIIRRELNPRFIVLREANRSVVLTDFELGKLLDGSPTVSEQWEDDDPYRAPEVSTGAIDVRADVYSWGRIVLHLMLGKLPPVGEEESELARCDGPRALTEIIARSVSLPRSSRPETMDEIIKTLDNIR